MPAKQSVTQQSIASAPQHERDESVEAPVSNQTEAQANGLDSTGSTSAIADAMALLGDLGPALLPALPLSQLVQLDPLGDLDVAREVAKHSATDIAEASPELAHRLIDRFLAVGTGVEFGAELKARALGLPCVGDGTLLLQRTGAASGRIECARSAAVQKTGAAGEELVSGSATAAVGVEQTLALELELEAGEVLDALGVGACFLLDAMNPATMAFESLLFAAFDGAGGRHGETRVFAEADASAAVGVEALMTPIGPFSQPAMVAGLLDAVKEGPWLERLHAAAAVGGDLQVVNDGEGTRFELGIDSSAAVDVGSALLDSIPGIGALTAALAHFDGSGDVSARLIGRFLPGQDHVGPGLEILVDTGSSRDGQGVSEQLVFRDAAMAAAAISGEGDCGDVGRALESSGIASLQRSVTRELPRDEEHTVLPDIASFLVRALGTSDALDSDHDLSITASCRVRADRMVPLFRGIPAPVGKTALEVAQEALEGCLNLTRGVALPPWMASIDPQQLLAAFELTSPRVVGRVELSASISDLVGAEPSEWDAGAHRAVVVDAEYDGAIVGSALWSL